MEKLRPQGLEFSLLWCSEGFSREDFGKFIWNAMLGGGFKHLWNVHPEAWGNDPI